MKSKNTHILLEINAKYKAAIDFLSNMIRKSPFKGKTFLAGGAVRDELMGLDPKDIDLVVELPQGGIKFAEYATKKMGNYKRGSNPVIFPKYGTAKFDLTGTWKGIKLDGVNIESVMTRSEEYSRGSRKPSVKPGTLKQDVERRDFTVNSLLKDLTTGEIKDLTGYGKSDLKKGIIKTPLNPDIIFTEDPLRMLRAIRFTVKYGWDLPMFMIKAIKNNSAKIKNISNERVREEFDKMIVSKRPKQAMRILKITGLLKYVMPELQSTMKVGQNIHHDEDVFNHIMKVVEKVPADVPKRLAALFHDIGKPTVKSIIDNEVHFYAHEKISADVAREVMKRLKYPNDIINKVTSIVSNHMKLKSTGKKGELATDKQLRKLKRNIGDHLEDLLDIMDADNSAHDPMSNMPDQITAIRKRLKILDKDKKSNKLPINGNDIIKLGVKPGPQIGVLLDKVQDAFDGNPKLTKQQALKIIKDNI